MCLKTVMNRKKTLQLQAIQAAKKQAWADAISYNEQLIELDATDLSAYNRLGVAHLQLDQKAAAQRIFEQALTVDKSNTIARKQLDRLKNNQAPAKPAFTLDHFIEEPGKTKTVNLHRLASKKVLEKVFVGDEAALVTKSRFISVEVGNTYIGALPEDLSFRLTKLINSGNQYGCTIRSITNANCTVFLREISRSKKNQHTNSFPIVKTQLTTINDIDDAFLDEDVPVQMVETDFDREQDISEVVKSIDE